MRLLKDDKALCKTMRMIFVYKNPWPKLKRKESVKKALEWGFVSVCNQDKNKVQITADGIDFCTRELGLSRS